MTDLNAVELGSLRIDVDDEPERVVLRFRGQSNPRDAQELNAFFGAKLLQASNRAIDCLFATLDNCNSATVAALIALVQDAKKAGVRLTFIYDGDKRWQRLSFEAMRVFSSADGLFELRAAEGRHA